MVILYVQIFSFSNSSADDFLEWAIPLQVAKRGDKGPNMTIEDGGATTTPQCVTGAGKQKDM